MNNVSVIITMCNQTPPQVTQAVESVLAQTYRDFEIIIVNYGSTDVIPHPSAAYFDRVKYVHQRHQEEMAAWSAGTKIARGAFLAFLRADEVMGPERLRHQVRVLKRQPPLGLVYFAGEIQEEYTTEFLRALQGERETELNSRRVALELFLGARPLIRRECIERAGLFEELPNSDEGWNPWVRIERAGYAVDQADRAVLCRENLRLYLSKVQAGEQCAAERHLLEAVRVNPIMLTTPEIFVQAVFEFVKSPQIDSLAFTEGMLEQLPLWASGLKRLRPRLLGELSIARAFQHYRIGRMSQVRRNVVKGLGYEWAFIKNRGVISILSKSLLPWKSQGNAELETLRAVLEDVQATLGQPVDWIEPTVDGTNRNTYFVRSGRGAAVLRLFEEREDRLGVRAVVGVMEQARDVGIQVPAVWGHRVPSPATDEKGWVVEEWVSGHAFVVPNLRWAEAMGVAQELGASLRQLHKLETKGFGMIISERLETKNETIDWWQGEGILDKSETVPGLPTKLIRQIESAIRFLREGYRESPKLCHGDLVHTNLIVNRGHLSAVIDWNGTRGSDPAFDIAVFHFWIGDERVLTTLLQAYAPNEPELFRRRIMAFVVCYAAHLMEHDFSKQMVDTQYLRRRCLWWLTDDAVWEQSGLQKEK